MPVDFPSSPSNGQSFTSGGTTWVWTVPPSAWKATSGPSGGASYLPITGGQLNPGGLLVGAAGTVPGQGALTLNANTVAPPAGLTANAYVVGADGGSTAVALDQFGSAGNPNIQFRKARGTAAAPTALQAGDVLGYLIYNGRGTTSYSGQANIGLAASENWTDTARGTTFYIGTTPAGGTASVNSLILAGNTATFSGNVNAASAINSTDGTQGTLGMGGSGARVYSNASVMAFYLPSGNGEFDWYNGAGSTQFMRLLNNGNLVISGTDGQKASGTTWSNPSSRDIKTDIKSYDKGLQAILALQPRTYRFRKDSGFDPKGTHIGLVHDETAHMPEMHTKAVIGGTADKPGREVDALDCSAVTWALCNAIKELKAEIDDLKIQLSKKA